MRGTILGDHSLQALIDDCSFIGGEKISEISKKLSEIAVLLCDEYIDEEKLDSMILEFAEMLDTMNTLFYTNTSGRNPLIQNNSIPEDLSVGADLSVPDFIADVAIRVGRLTDVEFMFYERDIPEILSTVRTYGTENKGRAKY